MVSYKDIRTSAIRKIRATLKKIDPDKINIEKLIFKICAEFGTSRRTAREYIQTAQARVNLYDPSKFREKAADI